MKVGVCLEVMIVQLPRGKKGRDRILSVDYNCAPSLLNGFLKLRAYTETGLSHFVKLREKFQRCACLCVLQQIMETPLDDTLGDEKLGHGGDINCSLKFDADWAFGFILGEADGAESKKSDICTLTYI